VFFWAAESTYTLPASIQTHAGFFLRLVLPEKYIFCNPSVLTGKNGVLD
jgi:hypothetical protein